MKIFSPDTGKNEKGYLGFRTKLKKIKIKNFRGFGANGTPANFEFSPMMIITGKNNSGKSSFMKFLQLLNNNKENIVNGIVDFNAGGLNLGTFDRVCNFFDTNNNLLEFSLVLKNWK